MFIFNFTSIPQMKQFLKEKASFIKSEKIKANHLKRLGQGQAANDIQNRIRYMDSMEFRIVFLAYCELRGRTRDQIEAKNKTDVWHMSYINKKVEEIKKMIVLNKDIVNAA